MESAHLYQAAKARALYSSAYLGNASEGRDLKSYLAFPRKISFFPLPRADDSGTLLPREILASLRISERVSDVLWRRQCKPHHHRPARWEVHTAWTRFAFLGVLNPMVASLGVVGNALILLVMTRRPMVGPTNCLLAALAVSDTLLLLLQVLYHPAVHGSKSRQAYHPASGYYWIVWYVASHVFLTTTCWLTAAAVIERFLSFRSNLRLPLRRIGLVVGAIFVAAVLLHLSKCFEYLPSTDICDTKPAKSTWLNKMPAYVKARTLLYIILVVLLPVVLMIVFNSFLLRYLIQHRKRMQRHTRTSSCDRQQVQNVGMAVFTVVLIFVLCNIPEIINSLNLIINREKAYNQEGLKIFCVYFKNFLAIVNSSVNFLVYVILNRKFRKTLVSLLDRNTACRAVCKMYVSFCGRCHCKDGLRQGMSLRSSVQLEAEGPDQDQAEMAAMPV